MTVHRAAPTNSRIDPAMAIVDETRKPTVCLIIPLKCSFVSGSSVKVVRKDSRAECQEGTNRPQQYQIISCFGFRPEVSRVMENGIEQNGIGSLRIIGSHVCNDDIVRQEFAWDSVVGADACGCVCVCAMGVEAKFVELTKTCLDTEGC